MDAGRPRREEYSSVAGWRFMRLVATQAHKNGQLNLNERPAHVTPSPAFQGLACGEFSGPPLNAYQYRNGLSRRVWRMPLFLSLSATCKNLEKSLAEHTKTALLLSTVKNHNHAFLWLYFFLHLTILVLTHTMPVWYGLCHSLSGGLATRRID